MQINTHEKPGAGLKQINSSKGGEVCETLKRRIEGVKRPIRYSPTESRNVFPKNEVYMILSGEDVRALLNCTCNRLSCRKGCSPASGQDITTIFNECRLILAILLTMGDLHLIHSFVEKRYTDELVLAHPLEQSTLEQLMTARTNTDFATNFHRTQYEFLLPDIPADSNCIYDFNMNQALPIDLKDKLGSGCYGEVYKAELLEGYHSLETQDGCVAVKIFKDSGDFEEEIENNNRFQHQHIVPILASLSHGEENNMALYPIAQKSLQALIRESVPTSPTYTTTRIVENVADLFAALNQIHTGVNGGRGYHLDIKPANILVCTDNSFALSDLGMAHFEPHQEGQQGPAFSEIWTGPCSEEYAGPELTGQHIGQSFDILAMGSGLLEQLGLIASRELMSQRIHRSFDIWGMGAVFLELLVWIAEGHDSVQKFHEARKSGRVCKIVASFHKDGKVKKEVLEKIESLKRLRANDSVFLGALKVIQLLLHPDEAMRPTSQEAEILLRTLLEDKVRAAPMTDFKPHVESLLCDFRNANKKELVKPRKLSIRSCATFIQSAFRMSQAPRQKGFFEASLGRKTGIGGVCILGATVMISMKYSWK